MAPCHQSMRAAVRGAAAAEAMAMAMLAGIIHATRKSNDRVSIEAEPCRSEGISAKGFIVMLSARQTV